MSSPIEQWRTLLTPLPPYFPSKEQWERQLETTSLGYCGIDPVLQPDLARRHHDIYWQRGRKLYPEDDRSLEVLSFLGLPDEETFLKVVPDRIFALMGKDADRARFDEVVSFIRTAHGHERRKSGKKELYVCHPLRAAWYYLSALETGSIHQGVHSRQETVETLLLHDVKENKPDQTTLTHRSITFDDALTGPVSLPISDRQSRALHILSSASENTYLQEVARSSLASKGKVFDRLDNMLTLFYVDSYPRMLRNLDETMRAMTHLSFYSQMGLSTIPALIRETVKNNFASYDFLHIIAQGMYLAFLQQLKHEVYQLTTDQILEEVPETLRDDVQSRGFFACEIPRFFGIRPLINWFDFPEKRPRFDLFSFEQISQQAVFLSHVMSPNQMKYRTFPEVPHSDHYVW